MKKIIFLVIILLTLTSCNFNLNNNTQGKKSSLKYEDVDVENMYCEFVEELNIYLDIFYSNFIVNTSIVKEMKENPKLIISTNGSEITKYIDKETDKTTRYELKVFGENGNISYNYL